MFYEISKILRLILVSPISWMIIALLTAVFTQQKKRKIALVMAAMLFLTFTDKPLFDFVKQLTVSKSETTLPDKEKPYDPAILLGAYSKISRTTGQLYHNNANAARLWEAVRLWRMGCVGRILISGDFTVFINDDGKTTAAEFLKYMEDHGVPRNVFLLEQHAKNTRQNALFSVEILKREGISVNDCLLVTTATHMKRGMGCFAKLGLHPTPFSVHPCEIRDDYNHVDYYPNWHTATNWEEIINEWVGLAVYHIAGYI